MKLLRWINFEVPVYFGKAWPRFVIQRCFRLPIWYLVVCIYGVFHIVTANYNELSTNDQMHIGILIFVWVLYTIFVLVRSVWNLATIQYHVKECGALVCETCFADMRGPEDTTACSACGAAFDRDGAVERWTHYCDWAKRHNKRARPQKPSGS